MKDGGPAFPTREIRDGEGNGIRQAEDGMTLRDYFAAQAMSAEIITSTSDATPESAYALMAAAKAARRTPEQQVASNAYKWADAMLAERAKATGAA